MSGPAGGSGTAARRSRGGRGPLARLYGASPWHLVALLGCFGLTAYAVSRLREDPALLRIALWFVGAAVVWDLVVGPLLALVDRGLRPLRGSPGRLPVINHVRVPALTSALLLLVWAPVILQRSEPVFRTKAGLDLDDYLGRWLVITAVLFVASALVYAVRRARRGPRTGEPGRPPAASSS
ncbi:MAG: hypothetical protein JWN88_512 [Frankiales bacterium]|jgi:hypothetical protein|nr:hypothetical protein [Frankiales bacterium]